MFDVLNDGFDAFKMFIALRNHFTQTSYDVFAYNGKTNVSRAAFDRRKDKYMFEKLARMPYARLRVVSCLIEGIDWINDINSDKGDRALLKHQKYCEATTYSFKQDLVGLPQPVGKLIGCADGYTVPRLAQLYYQKKVSLESLVIINDLVDFISIWRDKSSTDPLMQKLIQTICKYRPFVIYDKQKIIQTFTDFYLAKQISIPA